MVLCYSSLIRLRHYSHRALLLHVFCPPAVWNYTISPLSPPCKTPMVGIPHFAQHTTSPQSTQPPVCSIPQHFPSMVLQEPPDMSNTLCERQLDNYIQTLKKNHLVELKSLSAVNSPLPSVPCLNVMNHKTLQMFF